MVANPILVKEPECHESSSLHFPPFSIIFSYFLFLLVLTFLRCYVLTLFHLFVLCTSHFPFPQYEVASPPRSGGSPVRLSNKPCHSLILWINHWLKTENCNLFVSKRDGYWKCGVYIFEPVLLHKDTFRLSDSIKKLCWGEANLICKSALSRPQQRLLAGVECIGYLRVRTHTASVHQKGYKRKSSQF